MRGESKINNSHPLIAASNCLSAGGMGTTNCLAEVLLLREGLCSCCEKACEVHGESKINNNHPLIAASECLSAGGMGTTKLLG